MVLVQPMKDKVKPVLNIFEVNGLVVHHMGGDSIDRCSEILLWVFIVIDKISLPKALCR